MRMVKFTWNNQLSYVNGYLQYEVDGCISDQIASGHFFLKLRIYLKVIFDHPKWTSAAIL